MSQPEALPLHPSPLLSRILTRLHESYFNSPALPPSSPLILIYLNDHFTDGVYWITSRLHSQISLTNATAYRLPCWDVEVTETSVVLDVWEAQFASSKTVGIGLLTQIDHNPRVSEIVLRVRYMKMGTVAKDNRPGGVEKKEEAREQTEYVFPQYALDFLTHIYKVEK